MSDNPPVFCKRYVLYKYIFVHLSVYIGVPMYICYVCMYKVMLKILQVRLQYMNHELPDVQAGFKKAEEPEIKLPTSDAGSLEKQESSEKHLLLLY